MAPGMRIFGITALLGLFLLPGCPGLDDSCGAGHVNALSYTFHGCTSSDCSVADNAIAAGSTAQIDIAMGSDAVSIARVSSSDPSIATFVGSPVDETGNLAVAVTAGQPGITQLQLIDLHDGVAGYVTVTVTAAARLDSLIGSPGSDGTIGVAGFELVSFSVTPRDANGSALIGTTALTSTDGIAVVPSGDGVYTLLADAPGSGSVSGSLPGGPSFAITLRVDEPTAIVALAAVAAPPALASDGTDRLVAVTATPSDALGPVYGLGCGWTVADPSVTIVEPSADTSSQPSLMLPAGVVTTFRLPAGLTQTTATCSINGVSTQVTLGQ